MSDNVKVSGAWKVAVPYVKVSGAWKSALTYEKVSGAWKLSTGIAGTYSGTCTVTYTPAFPVEFYTGGSFSPTTDSTGVSGPSSFQDVYNASAFVSATFIIGGFSSDPGQTYFTTAGGKSSASASSYSYNSGTGAATWTWTNGPFGYSAGAGQAFTYS